MVADSKNKEKINFKINGEEKEIEINPDRNLLSFIREDLGLTGTKYGCGEGVCGSCTILIDCKPVKSCMLDVSTINGKEITTIEGLTGNDGGELHPIQKAFIEAGAVQCGYCTPAMILRTKWLLEKNPNPTREEAREAISPVICRCTGYQKIVDAVLLASERMEGD